MSFRHLLRFVSILAVATSFCSSNFKPAQRQREIASRRSLLPSNSIKEAFAAATLALIVLVGDPQQAVASSNTAGQISLNSIPPTTIKLDIKDLPVIGNVLSGTYTNIDTKSLTLTPSVVISSPKDKIKAVKTAITDGHLEFDVSGLVETHLDVDVASNEAGSVTIKVVSPLIPKLPFKNSASGDYCIVPTGKKSDWNKVVNMGDGNPYYYNTKTGLTQYEVPDKL